MHYLDSCSTHGTIVRQSSLAGCAIWNNWWPALTAILYVIVPMPYIFFGGASVSYDGSSGWLDAGKFLTGFSLIGVFAIPSILAHAKIITSGALALELVAAVLLCVSALVYDFVGDSESY